MKPMFSLPITVSSVSDILYICRSHSNVSACFVFGTLSEQIEAVALFKKKHIDGALFKAYPTSMTGEIRFDSGSVIRLLNTSELRTAPHFSYCLFSDTITKDAYRLISQRLVPYREQPKETEDVPSKELMEFISSFRVNKSGGANGD